MVESEGKEVLRAVEKRMLVRGVLGVVEAKKVVDVGVKVGLVSLWELVVLKYGIKK